jgi:hypothetical protein
VRHYWDGAGDSPHPDSYEIERWQRRDELARKHFPVVQAEDVRIGDHLGGGIDKHAFQAAIPGDHTHYVVKIASSGLEITIEELSIFWNYQAWTEMLYSMKHRGSNAIAQVTHLVEWQGVICGYLQRECRPLSADEEYAIDQGQMVPCCGGITDCQWCGGRGEYEAVDDETFEDVHNAFTDMVSACRALGVDDLHCGNVGWLGSRLVAFDYGMTDSGPSYLEEYLRRRE